MSASFRPPPGAQTRGFTQPVFISRYSNRGRRVRSVSRLLAALAAAWIVAVVLGSLAFMLTRGARTTYVNLPTAHRVDCSGSFPAGNWRLSRGNGAEAAGSRWIISVYSDQRLSSKQRLGTCHSAGALLPVLTGARGKAKPPPGLQCQRRSGDTLIIQQSGCVSGSGAQRTGFSWYPAVAGT
ncbi:MAG: hypothetical protein E6G56_11180 [Actinobacteria bacterium]|nr:MAG: hypothetical protein E6G56_11180 [Actinomycetota bacterium]